MNVEIITRNMTSPVMNSSMHFKRVWNDGRVQYGTIDFLDDDERDCFTYLLYRNGYDEVFDVTNVLLILY